MTEWNIKKKKKKKKRARVHRKRSGAHAEACGLCEVQEKHTQTHLVLFTESDARRSRRTGNQLH